MSQSLGYLILAFLLVIFAVSVLVAVVAVTDCLRRSVRRGDRQIAEAVAQMEAARRATPNTFTPQQRTR